MTQTLGRRTRLILTGALCILLIAQARDLKLPVSDFAAFWFAGTALVHGHNPYDPKAALALEKPLGLTQDGPWVMRNPPTALFVTVPLGLFGYSPAWILWTVLLSAAVAIAAGLCWKLYGGDPRRFWIAWLVSVAFAPTLAVLSIGQLGPLVLLGIAAFLWFESRNEFWAGAALVLITMKPQLVYLFLAAVLLWAIERRRWRLVAGAAGGFAAASAIAVALDAHVFAHYWRTFTASRVGTQFIPTLGGALRYWLGPGWLQVAPLCLGVLWFAYYWIRHHRHWDWLEQAPLLLLVSVLTTPYSFLNDEVVLAPVFVCVAARALSRKAWKPLMIAFLAVNALILVMLAVGPRAVSLYYLWTPPAWLLFYWLATRRQRISGEPVEADMRDCAQVSG